jgi:hypothetical protein
MYARLEAAREFWQMYRIKQQPNPLKTSIQFAIWLFKEVILKQSFSVLVNKSAIYFYLYTASITISES